MKVKFTKLAALLLAGAALFATGCTDYEVDIQKVDKKVDDLTADVNGKISSLEQQIAGINATIATLETAANHDKDIAAVRSEMAALKTTLENDFNGKLNDAVATLNAAIDKKLDKTTFDEAKQQITEALAAANQKIQALEAADQAFKDQIADLTAQVNSRLTALENLLKGDWDGKTVKETIDALNQKVVDLEASTAAQIGALDTRVTAAETAITKINEETIPAMKLQIAALETAKTQMEQDIADLKSGKLDKSEFEAYKTATAATIALMQAAIEELDATKVDKAEYEAKIAEILAKFDDYVLVKDFEEFKKIAATKAELAEAKAALEAKIAELKALIGEFPENTTVREYIDAEVANVQAQVDKIVKELIPELEKRIAKLEDTVNNVILPEIEFALGYEGYYTTAGGLQGYIIDWATEAYYAACDYTDEYMEFLIDQLNDILADIYDILSALAHRIQSIVYVPDYDDLKITTNVSGIVTTIENEDGETEEVAELIDQPFRVTYKVTPTAYAPYVLDYLYFDLKKVNARNGVAVEEEEDEDAEEPYLEILDVLDVDDYTGEIVMLVQAYNVASTSYVANANHPQYNVQLRDNGDPDRPGSGHHIWGTDHHTRGYVGYGDNYTWSIPTWNYEELKAYEARTPYAAALQLYNWDIFTGSLADDTYGDWDYFFENEISSNYNILYPDLDIYEIPSDPYKKLDTDEDEDGNTDVRLFTTEEQHQKLPYNTLRKEGEVAEGEDPGYRVILEDAVAAVVIDGKAYGLFAEDVQGGFHVIYTSEDADPILIPEVTISDKAEIEYIQGGDNEPVEENYIVNDATYAEVEMNGAKPASARKMEIGNFVKGTYTFTSAFGSFTAFGDVEITKELGSIDVSAEAVWTWNWNKDGEEDLGDALVDHNLFYGEEGPTTYVRLAWPVTIDAEGAAKLAEDLDVKLEDFAGLTPDPEDPEAYVIEVADRVEEGEPEFEALEEDSEFAIENVAIKDGKLYADFVNFEWDKIYKITAVYELEVATITVNGTFTTYDRNREMVTLPKYEYTFEINKLDEETGFGYIAGTEATTNEDGETTDGTAGYYFWQSEPMHAAIFELFDGEGVINVKDNVDFEFDADQEDFNEGELDGKIRAYNEEPGPGTAFKYIDINRNGIYAVTKSADSQISAKDLKEMNTGVQDENDPYVFLGKVLYRYITTYIGEVVEIPFQFNYRVPAYDFLHQDNYTFDDGKWYTMASPKYDPNKETLAKYDVNYMNVPALAFNIIDSDKRFFNYLDELEEDDATYFYDENLYINFFYTGPDPVDETELEAQSATDEITTYGDLWFMATDKGEEYSVEEAENYEHTVFYYRSIRDAIPMYGTLAIECDGVRFDIPTSFEVGSKGKYIASNYVEGGVEYSNYELRAWKPFYVPTYEQTVYIDLDEHVDYTANVLEGVQFFDARQVKASATVDEVQDPFVEGTYSIEGFNYGVKAYFRPMLGFNEVATDNDPDAAPVWGFVIGNDENGYVDGVSSWDAYDLQMKNFVFDNRSGVPQDLRRLISVDEENYVMTFDYNSQIEFMGTAEVSFSFDIQTPWQKFEKPFTVSVVIRGLDQQ